MTTTQPDANAVGMAGDAAFSRAAAVIATSTPDDYRVELRAGHHLLAADEPLSVGGQDTAPNPVMLLLSAIGSCTAITLRMYAERKGWPLTTVRVHLAYEKSEEEGNRITRRIDLLGELDEAQKARLLDIAERSPVTKAVSGGTPVVHVPAPRSADRASGPVSPASGQAQQQERGHLDRGHRDQ